MHGSTHAANVLDKVYVISDDEVLRWSSLMGEATEIEGFSLSIAEYY